MTLWGWLKDRLGVPVKERSVRCTTRTEVQSVIIIRTGDRTKTVRVIRAVTEPSKPLRPNEEHVRRIIGEP